ncbi:acyl-CoA thioesterase [Euzebya tangerina]|uniref:acyl-CoA thioesterase n=1 Tax=Euzebya tangerina TaxID=591198 RepID=UPI000E3237BA|nr:thioesterase family protein [Euzebya tangerina]
MSSDVFTHPVTVRYMEVDQQGVVFNSWYLAYFDDAFTAFLGAGGLPYQAMMDRGYDVQLVHNETTWRRGVRWGDDLRIQVTTARLGTTSFVLDFDARVGEESYVTASTTYVVIATDGTGKRSIPDFIRDVLGEPA